MASEPAMPELVSVPVSGSAGGTLKAAADNGWPAHMRATFALGLPLVGAQLAQMAINTTDVILVGWLGTTELASVVLATQLYFVVFIFGTGFASAVVPMVAQAIGRKDAVACAVRCGWGCGSCWPMVS